MSVEVKISPEAVEYVRPALTYGHDEVGLIAGEMRIDRLGILRSDAVSAFIGMRGDVANTLNLYSSLLLKDQTRLQRMLENFEKADAAMAKGLRG